MSFKLPDLRRFVFSSPWSPRHRITQSTEVLGWVFPMDWCFPPVKEFSFLLNSASKQLMSETRLSLDVYFRRNWRPWLGYCMYQKRFVWTGDEQLHLSSRGCPSETVMQPSGWVTDWDLAPPETSMLNQWTQLKQKVSILSQIGTMFHVQTRE